MRLYTFLDRKRVYSHLYRGVGLRLLSQPQGTSFTTINCILLALMHTWQVHVYRMYTHKYLHTYIQYIHCWEHSRRLERQRGWADAIGSADCEKSKYHKILENEYKISRRHTHFRKFRKTHWTIHASWSQQWTVLVERVFWKVIGAATSYILFFGTPLLCQNKFPYQSLGRHE